MVKVLLIGVGGLIGSIVRYFISGAAQSLFGATRFPAGTLIVNLIGCLFIGVLSQLAESRGALTDSTRAFAMVGVLGGFTTFSAFGNETMNAARSGDVMLAVINVLAQVVGGFCCVWLGRALAYAVWR
jgi:CrcB protein